MILAADVGGTKTVMALWDGLERPLSGTAERFLNRDHRSFEAILDAYRAKHGRAITAACVGVAGPVRDGRCEATNLPWTVCSKEIAARLGIERAFVINDLEAAAHGLATLRPEDVYELNAGAPGAFGNRAIIAAGTGLGEAGLYWDGADHRPFACEGGHADFAPGNELEIDLLRFLLREHDHVSWERIVSGPGLFNVYRFLRERGAEPPWVADRIASGDPSAVISELALAKQDATCDQALTLFVSLYGAEAGNLALKAMAKGGLYVGGGVAPKNFPRIKDGTFLRGFLAKGRMRPLLEAMPVRVILCDDTALRGAARYAARAMRAAGVR